MAQPTRTQKQIAEKYKGNLDYFKKPHFFRRLRGWLCLLALAGSITTILWLINRGDSLYNAGPLSEKHAHLTQNCQACHTVQNGTFAQILARARHQPNAPSWRTIADRLVQGTTRKEIDQACLQCHQGHDLHQPDSAMLAIADFRTQVALVHTRECSSCHREHKGPAPMRMPTSADCIACHGNPRQLRATMETVNLKGSQASPIAQVRQIQQGTWQFLAPQPSKVGQRTFSAFEKGHPPFEYEQVGLRDPNPLKFNHQRHEAPDIPKINGQKLDCAFCHKPTGDGSFYQPVTFQTSCQPCHALLFDPKNPELQIPHGDPSVVRAFLRSLPFQYSNLATQKGLKTPQQVNAFVSQQLLQLKQRVLSGEEFEKQIFFTANPYKTQPSTAHTLFPGCAYCHEVKPGTNGTPEIAKPIMADRWLLHGRFTHVQHTAVACSDCHNVHKSKESSDILMPGVKKCAECHHLHSTPQPTAQAGSVVSNQKSAQKQEASAECLSCHSFHSAPSVATALKQLAKQGTLGNGL